MVFSDFFIALDYFGVQINFNFKSHKNYKSTCGGSIFFIYIILCFAYISYTFTSFLKKNNKTVIYYDKELFGTDDIEFYKYNSSFAVNLVCDNYDGKYGDIYKIFRIEISHVQYLKLNGNSKKIKTSLPLHKCTYKDFYNKFNEELDRNEIINKFNCIDNMNYTVKGIFSDEDFEYFELTLSADLENGFDINTDLNIFYEYDCKFSLYYTDSAVDVANVNEPMRQFLNSKFIQLSPTDFKKVNLYFTIKNFKSDENWFFNMPAQENYLAYSSFEQYDVFKGENRFISKYKEFEKFARFFIRASTTRNIIERRYEKFTEFIASSISLLSAILVFLVAVISRINYLFALKEIVDTLCIDQKRNLEKKITLKKRFNNLKNIILFKNEKRLNFPKDGFNVINENKEINKEKTFTSSKFNKSEYQSNQKRKNTIAQFIESSENDNICCFNSQSQIDLTNNLSILNIKKTSTGMDHYLINDIKNESENYIYNTNSVRKKKYCNHNIKNFKNPDLSCTFNKLIYKNEVNSGLKFQLNNRNKKNSLILYNKILNTDSNENFDIKIKDKFTLLNNNIQASILNYKFCRLFSKCKKCNKNNEDALENSLNYLTKNLDIFTYLKTIKNQDMLINILIDSDSYDIFKKLESLHFNSNNIFDNDKIYILNKGRTRKSNINNLDCFWDSFAQLLKKTNKTQTERKLSELIIREINAV